MGDDRAVGGEGRAVARLPRRRRPVHRWARSVEDPRSARVKDPEEHRFEGPGVRPPVVVPGARDLRGGKVPPLATSVLRLCSSVALRLCRELCGRGRWPS